MRRPVYRCTSCGYETVKWLGRCPRCGGWDTIGPEEGLKEEVHARPVFMEEGFEEERIVLGIQELDRVLGGGLVVGSSILLGGDPGIGKTTLSFQIASRIVELGLKVLYVSGEESLKQLYLRRTRLGLKGNFPVLQTNRLDDILNAIEGESYSLVIVDSIQAIFNSRMPMASGSVGQIKDTSSRLIREMKARDIAHILIGHVTKEGLIAGPKILEHMVDTVLYFEGERVLPYRILRATKNRFGPVDEMGIFQMRKEGLVSVENPSEFFLSEGEVEGGIIFPYVTGTRPILLEVQAITPKTYFPIPKRVSLGYDTGRLFVVLAVLERHLNMPFYDKDIYVNITGGIRVDEPACDLAVASSVIASVKNMKVERTVAFFGEIGLGGEIRKVMNHELRIKECRRVGIGMVFCHRGVEKFEGIEVVGLKNVKELYESLSKIGSA